MITKGTNISVSTSQKNFPKKKNTQIQFMRSEEHYQGDRVLYGFPRSPRGGWSQEGADFSQKIEVSIQI